MSKALPVQAARVEDRGAKRLGCLSRGEPGRSRGLVSPRCRGSGMCEGGEQMGCVWQSEYAPEPKFGHVGIHQRTPARHRKPPLWRRAAREAGPLLAAVGQRCRPRLSLGRVAPARSR
jgi:hypothetical protein